MRQHDVALENPCFLAGETLQRKYAWSKPPWSHVLTVNAGYE